VKRIAVLAVLLALAGCTRSHKECSLYGYERGYLFAAETGATFSDQAAVAAAAQQRCQATPVWTKLD
jgi:hypothetical protein